MNDKIIHALRYAIPVICLAAAVGGYSAYEMTLVAWWLPVAAAIVTAAATAAPSADGWRWLTTSRSKAVNAACHLLIAGSLSYAACLLGNRLFTDGKSYEMSCTVDSKFQKTHTTYRTTTHRRRIPTGKRTNYYLRLTLDDGSTKTLHVQPEVYNRTKSGCRKRLTLQRGLFGFPVIIGTDDIR